jgi:hypothetical protein
MRSGISDSSFPLLAVEAINLQFKKIGVISCQGNMQIKEYLTKYSGGERLGGTSTSVLRKAALMLFYGRKIESTKAGWPSVT